MFSGLLTRVLIYALIVGACYAYVSALTARAVRSELKYVNLVAEVAQKTAIREAENKLKAAQAEKDYQANLKSHIEQLGAVLANSDNLLKKEKAKHETLESTIAYLKSERDILRNEVSGLAGLPQGQSHATDGAGSESSRHAAAFRTLEKACKLTTIDFNACRAAFDANCELTGCE